MTDKKTKEKGQQVHCIHWSVNVQAYEVDIPEGKFTVIDYDKDDREVYFRHYTMLVAHYKSEYKAASEALDKYLKGS